MKTCGEQQYINMPLLAARLYDHLTNVRGVNQGFEEMALFVAARVKEGNLLDVGYTIKTKELGNLPVYVRMELKKE